MQIQDVFIPFRVMVIKVVEMNKTLNRLANQKNEINYDLTQKKGSNSDLCKKHIL